MDKKYRRAQDIQHFNVVHITQLKIFGLNNSDIK